MKISETTLGRRALLAFSASAAAANAMSGSLSSAHADALNSAASSRLFRHGVASGDPVPTAVVLWTRVTPTMGSTPGSRRGPRVQVRWEVASDERFGQVVRRGRTYTGPGRDHTVKVDARGLEPGHQYYYRFICRDVTSPVGRTRTAPAKRSSARFRAGVVSCSKWEEGYFAAYRHLADRDDLDVVLHLGDYFYEDGGEGKVRDHDPKRETVTLSDYRRRHAQYKTDPDLARLHARYPFIVTWDDHEVTNDSWRDGAENHQPEEGDYAKRKARAQRVYDEWMPVRLAGTAKIGDGTRLFRRLRWGSLVDLLMLDLRSYRDEQVVTAAPFPLPQIQSEAESPDRTITGNRQMEWLKKAVSRPATQWKLVGNSVMIAPLSMAQLPTDAIEAINQVTGEVPSNGAPFNLDQWDGYTADRRELFAHLTDNDLDDVVFLTGDIHSAWASDLPIDAGTYPLSGSVGVEFVCTSVTSSNLDEATGSPPRTTTLVLEANLQANNPHIKYINFDDHGFSVLDVTTERAQMDFFALEDKTKRNSGAFLTASWETLSGSRTVSAARAPIV